MGLGRQQGPQLAAGGGGGDFRWVSGAAIAICSLNFAGLNLGSSVGSDLENNSEVTCFSWNC